MKTYRFRLWMVFSRIARAVLAPVLLLILTGALMSAQAPAAEEQNTGYVTTILSLDRVTAVCAALYRDFPAPPPAGSPAIPAAPSASAAAQPGLSPAPALTETIRAAYRKHGADKISPALAQLVQEAEGFCARGPFSPLQKTLTPPSGDKHDYLSFGPYWWPDPAKKDGLPYLRRDGEVNPDAVGPGSDRVALEQMAAGAETLALAYFFTREEKYAERAVLYLRTWFLDPATRMTPHLRYGQAIPGRTEGRGIGIIETRRLCQVLNATQLLRGSQAASGIGKGWDDLRNWFKDYLNWMRTSQNGKDERNERNNHGTWCDVQLACFALFLDDPAETAYARQLLTGALKHRLAEQVKPDGSQPHELARTRSFTYTLINLSGLLDLAELGRRCGVDYWNYPSAQQSLLREAVAFAGAYADPARKWPYQQITGFDALGLYPFLREAYYYTGQPRYRQMLDLLPAAPAARERAALLWPEAPAAQKQ